MKQAICILLLGLSLNSQSQTFTKPDFSVKKKDLQANFPNTNFKNFDDVGKLAGVYAFAARVNGKLGVFGNYNHVLVEPGPYDAFLFLRDCYLTNRIFLIRGINGKVGFANYDALGKNKIEPSYDKIECSNHILKCYNGNSVTYLDVYGLTEIPEEVALQRIADSEKSIAEFRQQQIKDSIQKENSLMSLIVFRKNNLVGLKDKSGKILAYPCFDHIYINNHDYHVNPDNLFCCNQYTYSSSFISGDDSEPVKIPIVNGSVSLVKKGHPYSFNLTPGQLTALNQKGWESKNACLHCSGVGTVTRHYTVIIKKGYTKTYQEKCVSCDLVTLANGSRGFPTVTKTVEVPDQVEQKSETLVCHQCQGKKGVHISLMPLPNQTYQIGLKGMDK